MSSISSLTGSSSSSSIYGNRTNNMITGLMSGMDTESMIEGLVQSYQQKIQNLQKDRTTLQWQQNAYQSISDKLVEFSRKYMSYTSNTNLLSSSFFSNAVTTTTVGNCADLVSATGKSNSTIQLNSVSKLASSARYTVSGSRIDQSIFTDALTGDITVTGGEFVLNGEYTTSNMNGSLTLTYGNKKITLSFDNDDSFASDDDKTKFDPNKLKATIEEQLKEQNITIGNSSKAASELIEVSVDDTGAISFKDKSSGGNAVYISGASGNFKDYIVDYDTAISDKSSSFKITDSKAPTTVIPNLKYLSDKTLTVTLDGKSKTITMPTYDASYDSDPSKWVEDLKNTLADAFGSDKITLGYENNKLSFTVSNGSTFSVTSSDTVVKSIMGLGESGLSSYINTSKTLGEMFGSTEDGKIQGLDGIATKGVDENGNYLYELTINGKSIGTFTKDTEMNTILNAINNSEAGVNVSYSQITGQFVFTAKESGSGGHIDFGDDLAKALFQPDQNTLNMKDLGWVAEDDTKTLSFEVGGENISVDVTSDTSLADLESKIQDQLKNTGITMELTDDGYVFKDQSGNDITPSFDDSAPSFTQAFLKYNPKNYSVAEQGQDAEFNVTINGKEMTLTRSSNSFDIDGMTITIKDTFTADEGPVTFNSTTDADTIVDTIKQMVADYNAILSEVKKAYSDVPLQQSNGSRYEPLTDEEMADMSDTAIENYEEKAKTGILFMDSDLSSLYNELRNAMSIGSNATSLRAIGINTEFSDGLTSITLDETALRQALQTNPEQVQSVFTQSKEYGASSDGLMTVLQRVTDKYAATTGATKGILIEKAGSKYAPASALQNDLLDKMGDIDDEIASWQEKMSNKVDYYTNKFTQLEMLMNEMNSQSSALAGFLGG